MGAGGAWFDYDNDGDLDLYMVMRTTSNMLFENDGSGSFTDVAAAAGVADASHDGAAVVTADFNNDGCKDLFLANSNEDVLFQNNCDGTFTDVTLGSGLDASGARRGTSATVGDYDGDGLLDLYVSHHMPVDGYGVPDDATRDQDYLFHNDGSFVFTDVSDDMLGSNRENASFIGGWSDYDRDGDLDIYLIRDCGFDGAGPMELYRNDGGTNGVTDWTFTEVAASADANYCQNGMGIAIGDYDRNGYMDFYFTDNGSDSGSSFPERAGTVLLANDGDGTFSDATDTFGVSSLNFSWGANFFDYNLDGWQDLYMAGGALNDASAMVSTMLWRNDAGTATDVTTGSGAEDLSRSRAGYYGDYDADGDPDMFLFNYGGTARLFRNDDASGNNWLIVDLEGVTSNRDGIGAWIELTTPDGVVQHFEVHSGSSLGGNDDTGAYFGLGSNASVTSIEINWPSGIVQTLNAVGVNQRMLIIEETGTPSGGLFTDVSAATGLNVTHVGDPADMPIGTGAAWFDYDDDGDLDLYMSNRVGANHLFQNNGGVFTDVAAAAGAADATGEGSGVAVADINNDSCVDIYLANTYEDVLLKNNCDGTFTDITTGSGVESSEDRRGTSASWGDYNDDGFVDLYVTNHMPAAAATPTGDTEQDYLYHNNGDDTFTDVSDMLLGTDREGRAFIAGWTDYDLDGDLDVYNIRDCPFGQNSGPMRLYRNDGGTNGTSDWTFTQIAETVGADWCQNGMGLATGDYDRDGDFDFFFTDNGAGTSEYPGQPNRSGTVLLRNDAGTFIDATDIAGVSSTEFSWGANFFDYDLDGWQDLYMVAGAMDPAIVQEGVLWQNNGGGTFTDVSAGSGGLNDPLNTRTSAYGDYDSDGDMDMFLVNYGQQAKLFRNDNSNGNNWLIVDLEGVTSNRMGIGARLELSTPDGVTQHFEVRSGSSLGAGDDVAAYFGLGTNGSVSLLEINWPSGAVQHIVPGINQRLLVVEEDNVGGSNLFTDVTVSAGVNVLHDGASVTDMGLGTGAAWFDYDDDGDQDLYMTMRTGANKLFQNNGGTFTDVAASAGVQDASHDGSGVAVADFDNDGDKDLYLANSDADVLFQNNGDGTFTDITAGSGLDASEERRGTSASWGDYDDDGYLDLYVAHHMAIAGNTVTGATEQIKAQDYIFHNNGDGTFSDVSDMLMGTDREGMGFIGGWSDYDLDGDLDVMVIHDCPFDLTSPQRLFRNDGGTDALTDWTFTEVSATVGADWCQNGMGLATGDYDRDGDFDFFFSDNGGNGTVPAGQMGRAGSIMLRNDGGTFTDATDVAGVDTPGLWSWGANFFDYNLDGYQDLYLAAGAMNTFDPVESVVWENNGDGTFTNTSSSSGGLNDPERTRTSVYGDYDGDGDPDMFLVNYAGNTKLFRNENNNFNYNNWIIIDLEGTNSNRDGIGARLELVTPGGTQYFETRSGSSLGGGDDLGAYFGLGTAGSVTSLTVTWPSGAIQTLFDLGINQRHLITEDGGATSSTLAASPTSIDFGEVEGGTSSDPELVTLTNEGVDPIDVTAVTVNGTDASEFSTDFMGPVTISGGGTSTFNVTFDPNPVTGPLSSGVLYRVNAGDDAIGDWEGDAAGSPSPYLLAGSTSIESDNDTPTLDASIPAGTPEGLFYDNRRDADKYDPTMQWDFPVTAGEQVEVRLYFVEFTRCSAGNRLFDVEIEGSIVLDDFDIYSEAGGACNVAIMRSFMATPADGNLDIDFPLANNKPSSVAAIEIIGTGGGTVIRTANLTIDHNGANGALNVDLTGEVASGPVNDPPTAAFSSTTTVLSVTFTDESTDSDGTVVSWSWDFGDGASSTDQNPIHAYAGNGTYPVTLTVTDDGGATGSITQDVTITGGNEAPTAVFTHDVDDLSVDFTDASTDSDGTVVSWSWDFGDGATSTDQNPTHVYAGYGIYTVTLTVTDDDGATGNVSNDVNVADPNASGPFIESAGLAVMESENFHVNTDRSGHMWVASTATTGFSGVSYMSGDPNDGSVYKKPNVGNSPEMTYDVDFTTTGTFYVWVRAWAADDDDNTLHMGLNGVASASKMEVSTYGAWEWTNVNMKNKVVTINVTSAGVNTINLWMREDGLLVDKIVLTNDAAFTPTGTGPAESPRGTASEKGFGGFDTLSLGETIDETPTEFSLGTNYPNPFNPTTTIQFALPETSGVTLEVYDTMGRRVALLVNNQLAAGRYEAVWNGRNDAGSSVASGLYLYRLKAGSFTETKTMMLLK